MPGGCRLKARCRARSCKGHRLDRNTSRTSTSNSRTPTPSMHAPTPNACPLGASAASRTSECLLKASRILALGRRALIKAPCKIAREAKRSLWRSACLRDARPTTETPKSGTRNDLFIFAHWRTDCCGTRFTTVDTPGPGSLCSAAHSRPCLADLRVRLGPCEALPLRALLGSGSPDPHLYAVLGARSRR